MISLTSHFLSNATLSNSATGRMIEIDAKDLVMKVALGKRVSENYRNLSEL